MNPLLRSPGNLLLAALVWSPLAAGMAGLGVGVGGLSWGPALLLLVPPMVAGFFLASSTFYVCRSEPLRLRRIGRLFLIHGAGGLFFALLFFILVFLTGTLLDLFFTQSWKQAVFRLTLVLLLAGLFIYLISILFHYLVLAVEEAGRSEREAMEERLAASRAELRALRDTVHPHFLFNSLTALEAFILSDPPRARLACLDLADFLRYTLRLGRQEWVAAADEREHAQAYLNIEKIRLGERLTFAWAVDAGVESFRLPALTLLPLIENAIKHGVAGRLDGGAITISLHCRGSGLRIEVSNPEPPADATTPPGGGHGLRTLADRLALHYGREIRPRIVRSSGRVIVSLDLPVSPEGKK